MVKPDADGTLMVSQPDVWKLMKVLQEVNSTLQIELTMVKARLKALEARP